MQRREENVAARLNGNSLQPLSDVSITVIDDKTGLPASLYSDNGVTPLAQPIKTDLNGYYGYYAANGEYTETLTSLRIATFTRKVELYDPDDDNLRASRPVTMPTPPSNPVENMGWINSTNGKYYVYLKDAGGAFQWVESYSADAAQSASVMEQLAAGTGSSLVTFTQAGAGAVPRNLQARGREWVFLSDFGAMGDGVADDAAAVNAALASGAKVVYGARKTYKINSSITVPPDVALLDAVFNAGTAGMNMVLFNTKSRIERVRCRGTGTVSTIERGFYPAADGVNGAYLDVAVENMTVGLQLCPLSSVTPHHNYINIEARDIVGTTGTSEGYAVLCSPANDNEIHIRATNIKRHAMYLSAGASRNRVFMHVDTCYHHALSLYSIAGQPTCDDNTVHIKAVNLQNAAGQSGLSVAAGITQGAKRNRVHVECVSSGQTDFAAYVNGVGSNVGPWPTDNVITVNAKGTFLGNAVCLSLDADNTVFSEPVIEGHGVNALIQFQDSAGNTYTPKRAGAVRGGTLNGVDNSCMGIANTAARGVADIGGGIMFANVYERVHDYTGTRTGINKQYRKTVQFNNLADASSASTTITLPESLEKMDAFAQVTSASAPTDTLRAVPTAYTGNSVTVAAYNRSGSTQGIINVTVLVNGD